MKQEYYDPWSNTKTKNGLDADLVISAMQKCIRRGEEDLAMPGDRLSEAVTVAKHSDCGYYEAVDQGKIRDIPYILGSTKNDILVTPKMMQKGEFSDLYKCAG